MPAAGAGIAGRDQGDLAGEQGAALGAVNPNRTLFQRLTQLIQHAAAKFRQFIEKQHAVVGERELPGTGDGTAPNQGGGRTAVVGAAKGALLHQPAPFHQKPQDRVDPGDLESFFGIEGGEKSGKPLGQHGFATSGCPTQQQMVPPCRGDFEGPAPMGLAVNIAQICWAGWRRVRFGRGGLGVCRTFAVDEQPAGLEHGDGAAQVWGWPDL